ncbi:MAG: hypothetical protein DRQ78_07505 [Epsilonproteobacteria bacterium]|nr:MAG: hypothetical protein DRQ78_07505 [Campylobacterota bacterium]
MKEFKFAIGDWSGDGHEKSDYVRFKSNKTADEIRRAYWEACCDTQVAFHHSDLVDYGNYNNMSKDVEVSRIKWRVLHGYEDNRLPAEVVERFEANGIRSDFFQEPLNEDGSQSISNAEELAKLLLWFISLPQEEFEYELISDQTECINGFWDKSLNVGFGYGLYF